MSAILAMVNALDHGALGRTAIGTTRWIVGDNQSDLVGIVRQIAEVPVLAADLDLGRSRFGGLRAYETGIAKEGVGAGGTAIAAMAKTRGAVTKGMILEEIDREYERIVNPWIKGR